METRGWVIEKAGFRVHTAMSLSEALSICASATVDLFLLCDSLTPEARSQALTLIHSSWPGVKRLVLTASSFTAEIEPDEEVFPAMEGPRNLVTAIRTLVVHGATSAS